MDELEIVGLTSGPPWSDAGDALWLLAQGRAPDGVAAVHLKLRSEFGGTLLAEGEATVQATAAGASFGWLMNSTDFGLKLICGRRFVVEAIGLDAGGAPLPASMVSGSYALVCKPPPPGASAPPDGGGEQDGGRPLPWPLIPCAASADQHALALLAALLTLAAAVALASPSWFVAAAALLAAAVLLGWWWRQCASPSECARLARRLWVYRWATLGSVLVAALNASLPALLVALACGLAAAGVVLRMTRLDCRLPDLLTPLSALPTQ